MPTPLPDSQPAGRDPNNPNFVLLRHTLLCLAAFCVPSFAGQLSLPVNYHKPSPAKPRVSKPVAASASDSTPITEAARSGQVIQGVKTTAYTHTEADHLQYGSSNAVGTDLKFGQMRSAAADWSIYPVGTVFQIQGNPAFYVVDDYGSALTGTRTIDLYKPDQTTVDSWGARKVNIRIVRWGSFSKSLAILMPRQMKASHVRQMIWRLVMRAET